MKKIVGNIGNGVLATVVWGASIGNVVLLA